MSKNKFKNEIDNNITVKITNVEETGVNHETGKNYTFDAVYIQLIGPTSEMGNVITYKEAKEIHKGLTEFLNTL